MRQVFVVFIFALVFSFVYDSHAQKTDKSGKKKTKRAKVGQPPSYDELMLVIGKPLNCFPAHSCKTWSPTETECADSNFTVCFERPDGLFVQIGFDSEKRPKKIFLHHDVEKWKAERTAEQIILFNGRGDFLNTSKDNFPGCDVDYTDEYRYLTVRYFSEGCRSLAPGSVTISWK